MQVQVLLLGDAQAYARKTRNWAGSDLGGTYPSHALFLVPMAMVLLAVLLMAKKKMNPRQRQIGSFTGAQDECNHVQLIPAGGRNACEHEAQRI